MIDSGSNRRAGRSGDRRCCPRGGRRAGDRPGKCPTLLVADGHTDLRSLYIRYLDRLNFQLETAGTADEVLAVLRHGRPAAILLDSRLPDLPPWHLGVWMWADRRAPRTPIIVLNETGSAEIGADPELQPEEVLDKPFELTAMTEAIRRALRAAPPAGAIPGP